MKRYIVEDIHGNPIKSFTTYKQAFTFKIISQRYDWRIR